MYKWKSSIEIGSTPKKDWEVLIDFENSPLWNSRVDKTVIITPDDFGENSIVEFRTGKHLTYMIAEKYKKPNYLKIKVVAEERNF